MKSVVLGCALLLIQCDSAASQQNTGRFHGEDDVAPVIFEAGKIPIESGPQMVAHVFMVVNESDATSDLTVKTSCGCLRAHLDRERLAPGESASLELAMEISNAGLTKERASVIHSTGRVDQFVLAANGTRDRSFAVFLRKARLGPDRRTEVRAYLIDSRGDGAPVAPTVVAPRSVQVVEATRITLEDATVTQFTRPTRQVGTLTLDFANYKGEFPVEVKLATARGLIAQRVIDKHK